MQDIFPHLQYKLYCLPSPASLLVIVFICGLFFEFEVNKKRIKKSFHKFFCQFGSHSLAFSLTLYPSLSSLPAWETHVQVWKNQSNHEHIISLFNSSSIVEIFWCVYANNFFVSHAICCQETFPCCVIVFLLLGKFHQIHRTSQKPSNLKSIIIPMGWRSFIF